MTLAETGLQHVEAVRQVKVALKHGLEVQGWFLVAIGLAGGAPPGRRISRGTGVRRTRGAAPRAG